MVNDLPREPQPTDADYRAWLLDRLDFMRTLVETGADCALEDAGYTARDGRRVMGTTLAFYESTWVAQHQARRRTA